MKQPSVATPESEDCVSDCSLPFVDEVDCNNAGGLLFFEGMLRAKEEELVRLRQEKDAAIESKIELMVELKLAKSEAVEMSRRKNSEAGTEKSKIDQMAEEIAVLAKELAEMTKILLQYQIEKAALLEFNIEMGKALSQIQTEKQEATNLTQAQKKKDQKHATEIGSLKARIAALEKKARSAEKKIEIDFVWKGSGTKVAINSSGSVVVDALVCPPLKAGTFEWKIRVDGAYDFTSLGVISSSKDAPLNQWLGKSKKTWGFYSNGSEGYAYHDNTHHGSNLPKFSNGSIIHFVLNLTGNGTLSVSVSGSSLVVIFSNMKSSLDEGEGFLPAVAFCRLGTTSAKIELLRIEHHLSN